MIDKIRHLLYKLKEYFHDNKGWCTLAGVGILFVLISLFINIIS